MFDHRTVIVAGAGTSVEFGLPSGEQIFTDFQNYHADDRPHGATYDELMSNFYSFTRAYEPRMQREVRACIEHLRGSASGSIDIFAHQRQEYAEVAKLMSTWSLFRKMPDAQRCCTNMLFRQDGEHFKKPWRRNWLAHVFQAYAHTAKSASDLVKDGLTFVTFNYDPLIEIGMASFLRNAFSDFKDQAAPPVYHVHGAFDHLPDSHTASDVAEQAGNIRYVLQRAEGEAVKGLERARAALKSADVIFCAGFAFDDMNWSLLELDDHAAQLRVLNYDDHPRLNATLDRLGVPPEQVWRGNPDRPLGVGEAARRGFFDQLAPERSVYETRGILSV